MLQQLYRTAILMLLLATLLPGYARAYVLGAIVNVQAWTSVGLLLLLGAHFLLRRNKSINILALLALFACAALLGYVRGGDADAVALHAFSFAPFVIAFLLLDLDVGAPFQTVMLGVTVSAAIGAIMANLIHWFHPELLGMILKEEENIKGVLDLGRVGWAGYVVALPVLAQLGFLDVYSRRQRLVVLAGVPIVLAGALLTFNRTLLVGLVCLALYLLYAKRRNIGIKGLSLLGAGIGAGAYFVAAWAQVNSKLMHLITYRVLYFFSGSSEIGGDVSTRTILYGEYLTRLEHSLLLGQGLGLPVSTYLGNSYWADVTLVSFAVPFGVAGVLLFVAFLRRLYRRIRVTIDDPRVRRLFTLVLLLGLAISLNDDIWSHKFFIVYFVYIVNSYRRLHLATPEYQRT